MAGLTSTASMSPDEGTSSTILPTEAPSSSAKEQVPSGENGHEMTLSTDAIPMECDEEGEEEEGEGEEDGEEEDEDDGDDEDEDEEGGPPRSQEPTPGDQEAAVEEGAAPVDTPVKRRPGRPKGSKNAIKKVLEGSGEGGLLKRGKRRRKKSHRWTKENKGVGRPSFRRAAMLDVLNDQAPDVIPPFVPPIPTDIADVLRQPPTPEVLASSHLIDGDGIPYDEDFLWRLFGHNVYGVFSGQYLSFGLWDMVNHLYATMSPELSSKVLGLHSLDDEAVKEDPAFVIPELGVPAIQRPSRKRYRRWRSWGLGPEASPEEGEEEPLEVKGPQLQQLEGASPKPKTGIKSRWRSLWRWRNENEDEAANGVYNLAGSGAESFQVSFTTLGEGGSKSGVVMRIPPTEGAGEDGGEEVVLDNLPADGASPPKKKAHTTTPRKAKGDLDLVKFWKVVPGGESEGEEGEPMLTEEQDQVLYDLKREQEHLLTVMQKNAVMAKDLHEKMCEAFEEVNRTLPARQEEFDLLMSYRNKTAERFAELAVDHRRELDDQNAECNICREGESGGRNCIAFCDRCNLAVHTFCYYVPCLPPGSWYCRSCEDLREMDVETTLERRCALCPAIGGAVLPTESGDWAHVGCCKWLGLVDPKGRVPALPPRLQKLRRKFGQDYSCCVRGCREPHVGGLVKCHAEGCKKFFHVTCGQRAKYEMYHGIRYKDKAWQAYCKDHSHKDRFKETVEAVRGTYEHNAEEEDVSKEYCDLWKDEDEEERVVRRGAGKQPKPGSKAEQLFLSYEKEIKNMEVRDALDRAQREKEMARAAAAKQMGLGNLKPLPTALPQENITKGVLIRPSQPAVPVVYPNGERHSPYDGCWGMAGVLSLAGDMREAIALAVEQLEFIHMPVKKLAKEFERRTGIPAVHLPEPPPELRGPPPFSNHGDRALPLPHQLPPLSSWARDNNTRGMGPPSWSRINGQPPAWRDPHERSDPIGAMYSQYNGQQMAGGSVMFGLPPPPPVQVAPPTNAFGGPASLDHSGRYNERSVDSGRVSSSSSTTSSRPPPRRHTLGYDSDSRRQRGNLEESSRKSFDSSQDFIKTKRVFGNGRFMCEYCGTRITTKANLDRHKKDSCPVKVKNQPPPPNLQELLAAAENVPPPPPPEDRRSGPKRSSRRFGVSGGERGMSQYGDEEGGDGWMEDPVARMREARDDKYDRVRRAMTDEEAEAGAGMMMMGGAPGFNRPFDSSPPSAAPRPSPGPRPPGPSPSPPSTHPPVVTDVMMI